MADGQAEIRRFVTDLAAASKSAVSDVDPIMKKGAQNIKDAMNADLAASRHFKGAAGSVTYDSHYKVGVVGYEIGPDKGRRGGALANIAYFGGSNGGGGTVDVDGPLQAEAPVIENELGKMIERLL